jgi:nucleotide-binding universal stress UspA family protein
VVEKKMKMQKHVLAAVGEDISQLYGVRFICSFFKNKPALKVALLYVMPDGSGTGGASKPVLTHFGKQALNVCERGLKAAQQFLTDRGFPLEHVSCKLMPKSFGTIKDIVREGKAGMYDAVVLGRRGYMIFENLLSQSVSRQMMDHDIFLPIWICRQPEEGRKNVLLCIDGSEAGLRIADHVGFMLHDEEEHRVTIFQVDTGDATNMQASMEDAKRALTDNGIPEERINTRARSSGKVAEAILQEAKDGAYAVVAVGRVGIQKGALKQWLVGSTSIKLLDSLDKAVLWVSR